MQRRTTKWSRLRTAACLMLCAGVLAVMLTGCGSAYKDGTYTARYRYPNGGYVEYLTVTFKGGRPVEAKYDGYQQNRPDVERSDVEKDTQWAKQNERFTRNILAAGTKAEKIGIVPGMTAETQRVRTLYAAILNAARAGRTTETVVENKPEKNDASDSGPDSGMNENEAASDSGMTESGSDSDMSGNTDAAESGSETDVTDESGMTGENGGVTDDSAMSGNGTDGGVPGNGTDDTAGNAANGTADGTDSGNVG